MLRYRRLSYGLLAAALLTISSTSQALKHSFETYIDARQLIGPVGVPFGFQAGGHYELTVFDFDLVVVGPQTSASADILKKAEPGFFLQRFENEAAFNHHMETLRTNSSACAFSYFHDEAGNDDLFPDDDTYSNIHHSEINSAEHGIMLSMKNKNQGETTIDYTFKKGEEGLYFLIYQVCPPNANLRSSFELDFHFMNRDSTGNVSYLTAGELPLPLVFFFFSMSYLACLVIWVTNIRDLQKGGRGHFDSPGAKIYTIHHLMSVLLLFKFLSVFFESIRYHFIRISGHAELWSFVYYAFTFIKGTFLFTVILLIGSGWSYVKPFLNEREKKLIAFILLLQVINNIAIVVLSRETEGEVSYDRWTAVLHLVDIVCCCAVLVPIVWQVNTLEKSIGEGGDDDDEDEVPIDEEEREMGGLEEGLESGEKGEILSKLKRFRTFYLLVIAYIYATRILIYLFATMLDYRHLWVRYFIIELVTLVFYVVVGLMFRPMIEGQRYESLDNEGDGGGQNGIQMKKIAD